MNEGGGGSGHIKHGRNVGRKPPELTFRRAELGLPSQNSNQIVFSNIQQIKNIYLNDTEKVPKEKLEGSVLNFATASDSLQMSPTLATLVNDESLLNLHPSESIGGLSRRLTSMQNLDESNSSTCDISELNATITPVTLLEESDGMMLVSQNSIKEVFSVPKPLFKDSPPPSKDGKDCVSSSALASNRVLDKLIHNCKLESNFTLPLRVSEYGKIPHMGLKPNFSPIKSAELIYDKMNQSTNCSSVPMLVDASQQQDLRLNDAMKNSFMPGTILHSAGSSSIMSTQEPQYCLAINPSMQCDPTSNATSVTSHLNVASTKDVFLNANCIISPSHSRQPMLSIGDPQQSAKRMSDGKNGTYHPADCVNKRVTNLNEPMLLHAETLYAAAAPISSASQNDSSQNMNYITDANMLSQINELATQTAKDSRSYRHVDILLSQLQRNGDAVLNLGSLPNSMSNDLCQHSNATTSEQSLNVGMCIEQNHLADLPPSPLMNADFLDNNSVIPKTSPCQQTFLPNLSTTTDLALSFSTHFLENSNMSIDMGSLSEGEGSLNVSHNFVESLDAGSNARKPCVELNFTNALKDAADKYDSTKLKMLAENLDSRELKPSGSILENRLTMASSVVRNDASFVKRRKATSPKIRNEVQHQKDITSVVEDKSLVEYKPVVQQVQCLKCSVCAFLSLDEAEMSLHMKNKHSNEEKSHSNSSSGSLNKQPSIQKKELHEDKVPSLCPPQPPAPKTNTFVDTNSTDHETSDSSEGGDIKDELYSPNDDDTNESNLSVDEVVVKYENTTATKKLDEQAALRCGVKGCVFRMKDVTNVEYHRKCHSNAFFVCPECGKKFAHWAILAMHLWKEHYIDMELHSCELCDYKCYSHTKLVNNHRSTHSNERPFLCDVCGKDFKTAKQLRSHKTLHLEKKEELMHRCDMCKRNFSEKRMLLSHLGAVHNKVKPYLCNYCGKSFASKSTLILHIRKHTGEKPFGCDVCLYRTSDHNSMRRHKMKHSNDKRYSCPYCSYSSIQSSTFKVHLKRKHDAQAQKDGLIFTCTVCTFKTVKRDNFLAHVATHHKSLDKSPSLAAKETSVSAPDKTVAKKRKRTKSVPPQSPAKVTKLEVQQVESVAEENPTSQSQQAFYVVQMPQVVNINWDTAEAVEVPATTDILNGIMARSISGQVVQVAALDDYDYDSSVIQPVELNNGWQITPEVIAVPITSNIATSSASQFPGGVLYVTAETEDTPSSSS